jgi:hypothetical protein
MEAPPLPPSLPPKISAAGPAGAPPVIGGPPRRPAKMGAFTKAFLAVIVGLLALGVGFVGVRIYQMRQWNKAHPEWGKGMSLFTRASHNLGPNGPVASGNSETAQKLAAEMSAAMTKLRDEGYSKAAEKALLDQRDNFRTYCELRSNQCVFLVHIPELRRFTKEAQTSLASDAWGVAELVLAKENAGKEGMKLAVGVEGLVFYERVMTGRWVADFKEDQEVRTGLEETETGPSADRWLYSWFEPEGTNAPLVGQP